MPRGLLWALRWVDRGLLLLVALGAGLACGARDLAAPFPSVLFYATPLPILCLGALAGAGLARLRGKRRRALAWAALFGILAVGTLGADWFPERAPVSVVDPIRVVSWNLHEGDAGQAAIQAGLEELDADLVCLAEVGHTRDRDRGFLRELDAHLRARGYVTRTWPGARLIVALRAADGTLGRLRLSKASGVALLLQVEATWRGRPLRIALTDFRSRPTLDRSPGTARVLEALESGATPWICAGDFNTPRASRCFDPWRAAGASHAFEAAGSGYAPTWPAPAPVLALDHVWSKGLLTSSAAAPLRAESDHCPLIAVLGWPPRR